MIGRRLHLDFESRSDVDIVKYGSYKYMESPEFKLLLLAYAFDDDPVKLVDLECGESWPEEFRAAVRDPSITKLARNAAFERNAIKTALGIYCPPENWIDTAVLAAQCGLPRSLEGSGEALGLEEDQAKLKDGKALIRYFCIPARPTKANGGRKWNLPEHAPEKWSRFREYCAQDVVTDRIQFHLLEQWLPSPEEHRFWCLDTRINEKGVRIDRKLAANAVAMNNRYKEELTAQAVAITGLENPKSVSQIKNWLFDQEGQMFPSLNKKVIADVVSQLKTEEARMFMELRSELSKSSTAKYEAMLRSQCADGTVKGCFLFYGANRTGRFAGRLVQFQNLPQNHMPDLAEARELVREGRYTTMLALYDGVSKPLSELIRTAIIPEEGHKIMVADFSAIEARVVAWFANEQWRLNVFESGGDIYCASASKMFHVPVVKHGVNGHLRQKGKVAELGLGYGGGVNALKAFGADKMGMSEEEMQETVDLWREGSPNIVALWRSLEKAAIRCVVRRMSAVSEVGKVRFSFESGILWMNLPSGRRIAYFGARYEPSKWDKTRKVLSYMGIDQNSKKWARVETWGGKLTENLVQATARDCLREAMFALDEEGYDIRAHVHDEVIATEPLEGRSVEEMSEVMGRPIPWAPGLPLRADGYETPFYKKD